jgi:hypothetical protein
MKFDLIYYPFMFAAGQVCFWFHTASVVQWSGLIMSALAATWIVVMAVGLDKPK